MSPRRSPQRGAFWRVMMQRGAFASARCSVISDGRDVAARFAGDRFEIKVILGQLAIYLTHEDSARRGGNLLCKLVGIRRAHLEVDPRAAAGVQARELNDASQQDGAQVEDRPIDWLHGLVAPLRVSYDEEILVGILIVEAPAQPPPRLRRALRANRLMGRGLRETLGPGQQAAPETAARRELRCTQVKSFYEFPRSEQLVARNLRLPLLLRSLF